jgi:hypothetical protein
MGLNSATIRMARKSQLATTQVVQGEIVLALAIPLKECLMGFLSIGAMSAGRRAALLVWATNVVAVALSWVLSIYGLMKKSC